MEHPKDKTPQPLESQYLGIIDFDSAIYRCAAVHEDDEECGLDSAKLTLLEFVQNNVVNPTQCKKYLFVLTGQDNFRRDLAVTKPYKGQRVSEKPIHYAELFDWAIEKFNCVVSEDMEADDWVVNCHRKYQGCSVLIGMDKDNLQSPGWHYNFVKNEARFITPWEAQWALAFQMLRGDPGDSIPGLPGIGEAKAAKFLNESPELPPMQVVYNVYKEKGLLGTYYNEQYQLLYMLCDTIIDFESSFIELEPVDMDGFEDEDDFDEDSPGVEL